jgi:26S proteasome regulatory subunit N2
MYGPLAEISYAAGKLEVLWEDERFGSRELSALVASKIFFYLEDYENSVRYALRAGSHFNVGTGQPGTSNEYVDTIVSKVIDEYIRLRNSNADLALAGKPQQPISPALESVVNRMLERCFEDSEFRQGEQKRFV